MWAEIGHFALLLAFALALLQSGAGFVAAARGDPALLALTRAAAGWQGALVGLAFAALAGLFVASDFSVALVAQHSHSTQPLVYRFAATWGNHEGSLLLWVLILAGFGGALAASGGSLRERFRARVLGVQGLIGVAFLAFLLFTSNPFARLSPAPLDGAELNPLLQDPGLALHPPLLYIGYVGFSIAFSFAMAALIEGRVDAAWARWVRPWVLAAWTFLTLGIALGSFWAYYELGWGGWWFWDPVENASLMPWLLGTALLHSALVLERRGALVSWTILLAILAFSLSLIGTFLVRSGILTSVHAFAVDPARGVFILAIIVAFTGAGLALFAWRAPAMKSGALFSGVSREAGLTLNNLFLLALTAVVFLGTFYPVMLEALDGSKISVGPPYYELVFVPLAIPLLVLVSVGPLLQWKRDVLRPVLAKLRWPALSALGAAGAALAVGGANVAGALGLALAAWLIVGAGAVLARRWRLEDGAGVLARAARTPLSVWGMALAHAGLGVMAAGIAAMSAWSASDTAVMRQGETRTIGAMAVTLVGTRDVVGPNYRASTADFTVRLHGRTHAVHSEKRFYPVSRNQTTEAGIAAGVLGNGYIAIGDAGASGLVVRMYDHPLVGWIWGGALLMGLGGFASLSDRRFRVGAAKPATPRLAPGMVPAE